MRLDVSYLPRLKNSDLELVFSRIDDEALKSLLVSYSLLSKGIDWLYPGEPRDPTSHLRIALSSLAEARLAEMASSLAGCGDRTVIQMAHAEAKMRKLVEAVYAEANPDHPVSIETRDLKIASERADDRLSLALNHLLKCDDRALQAFYGTFLATAVWASLCRGLIGEDSRLVDRLRRNMTDSARMVFDLELNWARKSPAALLIEAKLELMAHFHRLVVDGRIVI